ncbi:general transcription factor 3C polypeptide 2 [Ictalurus punctatus]|uniref:General transcription factor 3C polypeptide 2 n=1 Tax=Ictalurus punctatus TaxID=7998 RepID=A0A2D0T495_ICTPU|nr:general transcription factor 3C polypeptide 2 [Ictalurus punctatus]XP_017349723.1 general transcription factor 3C polypeptide 2 [Ictalurus punctatus]
MCCETSLMGVPCKNDTDDLNKQNNHMDTGTGGDTLGTKVLQDSNIKSNTLEEMYEGQTAASSQGPSDTEQEVLPPQNKPQKKRGRPRKTVNNQDSDPTKMKSAPSEVPVNHDSSAIPESPEMTPSGRPKRKAAKVALEYLHNISKDLEKFEKSFTKREQNGLGRSSSPSQKKPSGKARGKKRKAADDDSDLNDDADFDPGDHREVESEEDEDDDYEDSESCKQHYKNLPSNHKVVGNNGLSSSAMQPIWKSFRNTKEFRDKHSSSWVFPEWIPSVSDWHLLSFREAEKYLPQEKESMSFTLDREGIKEQGTLQKVKRFESMSPNAERWDSLFFVGGPVWAMEWCPVPEGAAHTQYAALYCNRNMDDRHKINTLHTEHALLQLWDLGKLQMSRPLSSPRLAYALAVDDGCIWNLKWCPAGAWEVPTTVRKAPHVPRLGLIAAAFSNGNIGVYSLPHPEHLQAQNQATGESSQAPQIYQVQRIMTLQVGASQADHKGRSGLCFALDWLPLKPHNILAAGFCDGMVALWDLNTKSSLLRVRSPDRSISLYPYHCFLAHENTIRCLSWCRASSELMVTVGDDRMIKLWNLTKTCTPLKAIKRFLHTDVSWPIFWPGVFLTQESCYATLGQQGLHYFDSGYFGYKPLFVCSRKATVWSFSVSDWMNSCVIGDNIGEFVCSVLCDPNCNYSNSKRHRFPVYRTELVQFEPGQRTEEEKEEEHDSTQQEPQTYIGAIRKYYLRFHDMDLRSFIKYQQKPILKQLHASETKGLLSVDQMPLNALYKVCFNPNMDAHSWVLSAGQSGLVRVHCVSGLDGPVMHKLIHEAQAQFSTMFCSQEKDTSATTVHQCMAETVQVP